MTIGELFKNRQSIYYKNLGKYMKYVMNDHFVILLLVLGGASGLAYQDYLESVQVGAWLPRVILLFIIMLVVFSGSVRTLVKPADAVFLLPKEKEFTTIMKRHLIYSLLFHNFYTVVLGILSLPLLNAVQHTQSNNRIFWIGSLLLWKTAHVIHAYYALKQHNNETKRLLHIVIFITSFIGIILSIFFSVLVGFSVAIAALGTLTLYVFKNARVENWNWEELIETEQKRTQKIYSMINMFIETPYSKHKVKRLRVFDFLYNVPVFKTDPEIYYLSRMFIRNYNFSGLYLRLILIGSIVLYFSNNGIVNSLISVLFLYLIGFQLIPLRQAFNKSVYFRLYPNTDTDKINSIQKLLLILLAGSTFVYTLASINSGWITAAALLIINSLFIWLFVYIYLPKRLIK